MSDLRTAAQQALEALEADCCGGCDAEYNPCRQRRLAESLRAALAQKQAEPLNLSDPAVQKRLATQWGYVPAAQAEPVEPVEPVAVVATQSDVWRGYNGQWAPPGEPIKMVQMLRDLPTGTLLYTAPPQRKPLTDEEIERIGMKHVTLREVIRAVERAHGIKEN